MSRLWKACQNGDQEEAKELIAKAETDVNSYYSGISPLLLCCASGEREILQSLLQRPDLLLDLKNQHGETALDAASSQGHYEIAKRLLEDPRVHLHPLLRACIEGRKEEVAAFLCSSPSLANMATPGICSPLYLASSFNHVETVKLLLQCAGLKVQMATKKKKECPLFVACKHGHAAVVECLVADSRINVNKEDHMGKSPLIIACEGGHLEVVERLLNHPDHLINGRDKNDRTPLFSVCHNRHSHVLDLLLTRKDLDVNLPGPKGQSPFFCACQKGFPEIVGRLLMVQELDANQPDEYGNTPLSAAAHRGRMPVVEMLLLSGRVEMIKSTSTQGNPLVPSAREANLDTVKLLLAHCDIKYAEEQAKEIPRVAELVARFGYEEMASQLMVYSRDPRGFCLHLRREMCLDGIEKTLLFTLPTATK